MRFENTEVWGFEHALRGMRNPLNSWFKSDTEVYYDDEGLKTDIGGNDMTLAKRLITGGSEHRKFLRQIFVSVDITAPLYWWKEFDTYKVGTTANSTSTMHTLLKRPITISRFELDDIDDEVFSEAHISDIIKICEDLRKKCVETDDKRYWKELVRWLPEGWLQTRTVTMNYENLLNMYHQRKHHKLTEWSVKFCDWVKGLPYAKEFVGYGSYLDSCDSSDDSYGGVCRSGSREKEENGERS